MENLNFLTKEQVLEIGKNYKLPVYVYSENKLLESVDSFKNFPSAFGHTTRFAMKANSNKTILKLFNKNGLKIDASSEFEVYRAISSGYNPKDVQVSGQELSENLEELVDVGVFFVATSLHQIEEIGKLKPGKEIGIRINPGVGSGAFKAIATGGLTSGFGIWHEYIPQIKELVKKYDLKVKKIHLHIGSENTPESWVNTANIGLEYIEIFKDADILDMGGGFKMAIMPYEKSADLQSIGNAVKQKIEDFYKKTGRKIHLELEPGKYLVINSCSVIARINDIVDTGKEGYKFLRLNTGMTEMPRVPMYGVQEPIIVINDSLEEEDYVVIGHCCESGDLLTSKLYDQETVAPRKLKKANIGDLIVVEGTGAYNSSMSMKNYNSYPEAGELFINSNLEIKEIRKRQILSDIWKNEIDIL